MACLKNNGTELLRIERITDRISVRSNGRVLRDYGTGWKKWRLCPIGSNPHDHAEAIRKDAAARDQETTAFNTYKRAIIAAFPRLEWRARVHRALQVAARRGIHCVMEYMDLYDRPPQALVEPLLPLFLAAVDEKIETKLNDL